MDGRQNHRRGGIEETTEARNKGWRNTGSRVESSGGRKRGEATISRKTRKRKKRRRGWKERNVFRGSPAGSRDRHGHLQSTYTLNLGRSVIFDSYYNIIIWFTLFIYFYFYFYFFLIFFWHVSTPSPQCPDRSEKKEKREKRQATV